MRSRFRAEDSAEDSADDGAEDSADGEPSAATLREEVTEGVRWLWRHGPLRLIAITAAGLQLAISGIGLVAIVKARDLGASSATIGLLFSALGIGGVIGALLVPRLKAWLGFGGLLLAVLWLQAALWGRRSQSPTACC